jgi:hypothetical protein
MINLLTQLVKETLESLILTIEMLLEQMDILQKTLSAMASKAGKQRYKSSTLLSITTESIQNIPILDKHKSMKSLF